MTPERVIWLYNLSREEKRVRVDIADFKIAIKNSKASLNNSNGFPGFEKCSIRYHKKSIRALRRQIGLRPLGRNGLFDPTGTCPRCRGLVIRREHDCCAECGQKLRWK